MATQPSGVLGVRGPEMPPPTESSEKFTNVKVQFGDGSVHIFRSKADLIRAMTEDNENRDRWN